MPLDQPRDEKGLNRYRVSTMVLASHRDLSSGAIIASLSNPWGSSKGDDDLGGYHLVWPRDLVEIAGGLFAAGATDAAEWVLGYLMAVREADGHWVQNSWLDGRPGSAMPLAWTHRHGEKRATIPGCQIQGPVDGDVAIL